MGANAKVYVGTYKKYNGGSLAGAWLSLADFKDYGAFLAACKKLHNDEADPEFLIEDSEGFPDGLDCLEWLYEDDFNDVKKAMAEAGAGDDDTPATPAVEVVAYSDKAFAVIGDTKPICAELKKLGGRFNKRLSCGAGWIFSNGKRAAVDAFIATYNGGAAPASPKANNDGKMFKGWLDESGGDKTYNVGAIKLHDGFVMIPKPSIKNRFCFHDEGPDYDFYEELMADDKKLADYFKERNLNDFDWKIKHIEEGDMYTKDNRVWWYKNTQNEKRVYLCFNPHGWNIDKYTLCTEEERALILGGLKYGRMMLEKRLDSYLKKYGVSKLHTWTYWADA